MILPLDIQHNLRSQRKNLGFVALCVFVIGLGMAVSVTMYSFITGSVYTPMPFPDGDRYVAIQRIDPDTRQVELIPTTDDLQRRPSIVGKTYIVFRGT